MYLCFASVHRKEFIMCPSNCQQNPSHDHDFFAKKDMWLIPKTTKETKFIPDDNPLVNNQIFSFLKLLFVHYQSTKKKKEISVITALHVNMLVAAR